MLFLCFSCMSGDVSKKELERWLTDKFFPHERGFFLPSEAGLIRKREYIKYMKKDGKSRP